MGLVYFGQSDTYNLTHMTWVIGQPTIFGQIILISDIQVTFTNISTGDVSYSDCLRKMYQMDENIITGFAGNIIGAFVLLSSLSKTIKQNKKNPSDMYEPNELIDQYALIAKRDFARLKPEAKEGGIHFIIGGISHSVDMGIEGMGKPTLAILKSPEFKPEYITLGNWSSIGSGASEKQYLDLVKKASGDPYHPLMEHGEDFYFQSISIYLTYESQKLPAVPGISQHFHIACLTRRGVSGGTSDHNEYPNTGKEVHIKMPKVAESLDEFLSLMKTTNMSDSLAIG